MPTGNHQIGRFVGGHGGRLGGTGGVKAMGSGDPLIMRSSNRGTGDPTTTDGVLELWPPLADVLLKSSRLKWGAAFFIKRVWHISQTSAGRVLDPSGGICFVRHIWQRIRPQCLQFALTSEDPNG